METNPYTEPQVPTSPASPLKNGGGWLVNALVCIAVVAILLAFLLPNVRQARGPARRALCRNHLKQIGLALHNYHEVYGCLPPAYTIDDQGRRLHSWRTLILPWMDEQETYDQIDLSKAWDDPVHDNIRLSRPSYACPSAELPQGHTLYQAVVGEHFAFPEGQRRSLQQFTDGPFETILVAEVPTKYSVHWMSPEDNAAQTFPETADPDTAPHSGGMQMLLADGTVHFISATTDANTRKALLTVDAGDVVPEY